MNDPRQPTDRERSRFQAKMFGAIQSINVMTWVDREIAPKLEQLFEKNQSIKMMKEYKQQGEPEMLDFIDDYIRLSEINRPVDNIGLQQTIAKVTGNYPNQQNAQKIKPKYQEPFNQGALR